MGLKFNDAVLTSMSGIWSDSTPSPRHATMEERRLSKPRPRVVEKRRGAREQENKQLNTLAEVSS